MDMGPSFPDIVKKRNEREDEAVRRKFLPGRRVEFDNRNQQSS